MKISRQNLSKLYQTLADDQLTILDVICLIVAVPTTILYKIFFGGTSASPPFSSAQVSAITGAPWPWPALPASEPVQVTTTPAFPPEVLRVIVILYLVTGVFGVTITDITADYTAAKNAINGGGDAPDGLNTLSVCTLTIAFITWAINFSTSFSAADLGKLPTRLNISAAAVGGGIPFLTDLYCVIASGTGKLARLSERKFTVLQSLGGLVGIALGAARVDEMRKDPTNSEAAQTSALLGYFAPTFKFLSNFFSDEPTSTYALLLIMASVDAASDAGGAVATVISLFESAEQNNNYAA